MDFINNDLLNQRIENCDSYTWFKTKEEADSYAKDIGFPSVVEFIEEFWFVFTKETI